jgi:hypothetical protein
MNPLAVAQLTVAILQAVNLGLGEIKLIWDTIRSKNPELPELTTAEIAAIAEGKFTALLERIRSQRS